MTSAPSLFVILKGWLKEADLKGWSIPSEVPETPSMLVLINKAKAGAPHYAVYDKIVRTCCPKSGYRTFAVSDPKFFTKLKQSMRQSENAYTKRCKRNEARNT